jgi:predicted  nucleic acid-binding Zn-ribbon protein
MEASKDTDVIEQLIRLQDIDRKRDRLQRKLDEVPVKLKRFTDALTEFNSALEEQRALALAARAESDRAELEVKTKEEQREKYKLQMNAPKLTKREYEVVQEALAGVIADIRSFETQAIQAIQRAEEAEAKRDAIVKERDALQAEYDAARGRLEGSLTGVKEDLEQLDARRSGFIEEITETETLHVYERVRVKHKDALAALEGVDRNSTKLGNDIHCSACYMACTANDAIQVLGRKRVVQCKSCVRILYVP